MISCRHCTRPQLYACPPCTFGLSLLISLSRLPGVTIQSCALTPDSMCSNIDHSNAEVRRDLFHWAEWLGAQLPLAGLRLDAIKHYSASFQRDLLAHVDRTVGRDWFIVGEYWRADAKVLAGYVEFMNHRLSLFDVPLVESFLRVSNGLEPDLRRVFEGSLASVKPANAVVGAIYWS